MEELEKLISQLVKEIEERQIKLLAAQRELWWLENPHIISFHNGYTMESDDEGGGYAVWQPSCFSIDHLVSEKQCLIDEEDEDINFYDEDDPYPGFQDWSLKVVRNPNYAS